MTLKVKLLRSGKLQRVICMECGKEFVDLLLSLLIMPVGTILKNLGESDVVKNDYNGLYNLYESMKQLEESAFAVDRKSLINPVVYGGYCNDFLRLTGAKSEECFNPECENETQFTRQICDGCETVNWNACPSVQQSGSSTRCLLNFKRQTYGYGRCSSCEEWVNHYAVVLRRKRTTSSGDGASTSLSGGFVKKNITFMVMEDLSITKSSALSTVALLQSMKSDFSDLDMKEVDVGKKEGLLLVGAAMVSKNPLTDVFEPFFG